MVSENKNQTILPSNKEKRVCHYKKLFISTEGDIYPCCQRILHTKIGNINDENIFETIESKVIECECSMFKSVPQKSNDKISLNYLNLELSLLCQAYCLVCYTHSPYWKGKYDLYSRLEMLIDKYTPKTIIVQGGEILVQQKSLEWIESIKTKYPEIDFQIVTNCCVDVEKTTIIEKLFETMTVSFMGFQPETYKSVMGLEIDKTLKILDKLFKNNIVNIRLKFVETPSSLHESHLFLEWALTQNPSKIYMHDSDVFKRVNTQVEWAFDYWKVLYEKTGVKIRKVLLKNKDKIASKENYISFFSRNAKLYNINAEFLEENGLTKSIVIV